MNSTRSPESITSSGNTAFLELLSDSAKQAAHDCKEMTDNLHPDYDKERDGEDEVAFVAMLYRELRNRGVDLESLSFEYGKENIDLAYGKKGIWNLGKKRPKELVLMEVKPIWRLKKKDGLLYKGDSDRIALDIGNLLEARRKSEPKAILVLIIPFIGKDELNQSVKSECRELAKSANIIQIVC